MIVFSSFELSPTDELEVQKQLEASRKKYALISHIIWESECPQNKIDGFDREMLEREGLDD